MRRFRVAQHSMLPNLSPGDEVVATSSREPQLGDVVIFEHPARAGFWMVKRMTPSPSPLEPGWAWVGSDNSEVTEADSRSFGPIPIEDLMPVVTRLDAELFEEAIDLLASEDEALASIVERFGVPWFWEREPGFATLVLLILEQQVSLESGAAMFARMAALVGEVTPESVVELGVDGMRSIGVTRQKAGYVYDLAKAVLGGDLDPISLDHLPSNEARGQLLARRGIGPWTADAYLLSALRHLDVFPIGDRALQVGVAEVLGMDRPADPEELEILSRPWKPIRAVAARLIWHDYLCRRGRTDPDEAETVHGV